MTGAWSKSDNETHPETFARATGKRHMLSDAVSKPVEHKLGLLESIFATMCREPTGNEASTEDREVKITRDSIYGSSHIDSYLHCPWTFHLYEPIKSLTASFLQIACLHWFYCWDRFAFPIIKTIRSTCPNLISTTVAHSLFVSPCECSDSSR